MKQKYNLTQGNVIQTLVRATLPMILGILSMVAFNLADTYFVGQLGKYELAALSLTFPVVLVIGSIAQGLGIGVSALVSRAYGEGDKQKLTRMATDSLLLGLSVVIVFVTIGLFTIEPLFTFIGADENTLPFVKEYMSIWYFGVIFVIIPMIGNNAIRGIGDTKTPSIIMLVAVFVNIVLDPLLIFGYGPFPSLGITGAAIATVTARAITMVVSLWVLFKREKLTSLKNISLKKTFVNWKKILYIGIPGAGSKIVIPLAIGVITKIISQYGNDAIAGYGVGTRIETFALSIVNALSTVIGPFIGQNFGAKKYDRIRKGIKYGSFFSVVFSLVLYGFIIIFAREIALIFNESEGIVNVITLYLRIVALGYGFQGIYLLATSSLNTLNKPFHSTLITIIEMFVLSIPLALLGSYLFKATGIFIGIAISYIITGSFAYFMVTRTFEKIVKHEEKSI